MKASEASEGRGFAKQHNHSGVANDLGISVCHQPLQIHAQVAIQVLAKMHQSIGRRLPNSRYNRFSQPQILDLLFPANLPPLS